ncbi:MAG TPA: hypothetical protein VLY20_00070 [Nitrospiria bacterium]|nr:hypothetical protein [Nitrospiria bacterium]
MNRSVFVMAFRWTVDGGFLKSRSNVAVVEISIIVDGYSIKSRKDRLLVTLPARWSRSDASKASKNSLR